MEEWVNLVLLLANSVHSWDNAPNANGYHLPTEEIIADAFPTLQGRSDASSAGLECLHGNPQGCAEGTCPVAGAGCPAKSHQREAVRAAEPVHPDGRRGLSC